MHTRPPITTPLALGLVVSGHLSLIAAESSAGTPSGPDALEAYTAQVPEIEGPAWPPDHPINSPDDLTPISRAVFARLTARQNPFGIYYDGKGAWRFPKDKGDEICRFLGHMHVLSEGWGILGVRIEGHDEEYVLLFPNEGKEELGENLRLDYAPLIASRPHRAGSVIMYHEQARSDEWRRHVMVSPGILMWIGAMRDLGFDIKFVHNREELNKQLIRHRPDIVLVSACEGAIASARHAYFAAKGANPSAVTILGGLAAIPEFANYFDIVIQGEGEIVLPLVLNRIYEMMDHGLLEDGRAVTIDEEIAPADLEFYTTSCFSDAAFPNHRFTPIFTRKTAGEMLTLSATRYIGAGGENFPLDIPVAHFQDGTPRMFIKTDLGPASITGEPLDRRLERARARWKARFPDSDFPLSVRAFNRAIRPEPVTPDEIDSLYVRYPAPEDTRHLYPSRPIALHAQRGCRIESDRRCVFCSVKSEADGRRASIGHIIRQMKTAAIGGAQGFTFDDDFFTQNPHCVSMLVSRIKEEGLHYHLRLLAQTRGDHLQPEMIRELRSIEMGLHLGVETLSPARAERMGKVPPGRGEWYVQRVERNIRLLADDPTDWDALYMIAVSPGDSLIDIADDNYRQLRLSSEIKERRGHVLHFSYNNQQVPVYGDRITAGLTGYENAQPLIMKAGTLPVLGGRIRGRFHIFGFGRGGDRNNLDGIFEPDDFTLPPETALFGSKEIVAWGMDTNPCDIYEGINKVIRCVGRDMARSQVKKIKDILAMARPYYEKLRG